MTAKKRPRGRPVGSKKTNAASCTVVARITRAQHDKLENLPGQTVADKIRRMIDAQR